MSRSRIIWSLTCLLVGAVATSHAQESKAPRPARPAASQAPAARAERPANATARCKDGTYWTNAARQGACSSHGGVQEWLTAAAAGAAPANATARCNDGSYWTNAARQGACSGHGGVKEWMGQHGDAAKRPADGQKAPPPAGSSKAPGAVKRN